MLKMLKNILVVMAMFLSFAGVAQAAENTQSYTDSKPAENKSKMKGRSLFGGELVLGNGVKAWQTVHNEAGDAPFKFIVVQEPVTGISVMGNHYSYCTESTWVINNSEILRPTNRHNFTTDSNFSLTMRFTDDEWVKLGNAKAIEFNLCSKHFTLTQEERAAILYLQTLAKQKR